MLVSRYQLFHNTEQMPGRASAHIGALATKETPQDEVQLEDDERNSSRNGPLFSLKKDVPHTIWLPECLRTVIELEVGREVDQLTSRSVLEAIDEPSI